MQSNKNGLKNIVKPAFSYYKEINELLRQRGTSPELPLKTLSDLNRKLWGLKRGQLHVVGARTSHGKSSFCLQIARDLASQDFAVLYLSLEMSSVQCLERLLCQEYKIKNSDLLTGKQHYYINDIKDFGIKLQKWRLVISDCVGRSWKEIDNLIMSLTTKPDVIIVDHVQMSRQSTNTGKRDLDEYIKNFREMAMRDNFAAILVSQINRLSQDSDNREPQLHNLKGCIHPDSLVEGKTIKEIVDRKLPIKVTTYDTEKKKIKKVKPTSYIHSGKRKCLKIKTKSGKEIILSRGTKLYDGRVWRGAKTFLVGQKILVDFSRNS